MNDDVIEMQSKGIFNGLEIGKPYRIKGQVGIVLAEYQEDEDHGE